MISFSNLPELVVRQILKHAMRDAGCLKNKLLYLAVCHSWRHAALLLAYEEAYICCSYGKEDIRWRTNIDLLVYTGYCSIAKQLTVAYFVEDVQTAEQIKPFLHFLNMEPIQWPAEHQQNLVSLNDDVYEYDGPWLLMEGKLLQTVERAVREFSQKFPNVKKMALSCADRSGPSAQVNTMLVRAFADQLRSLSSGRLFGEYLSHMLDNLTSLTYECDWRSMSLLSKVSILPLEKLYLRSLTTGFSWKLFHKDPNSNEPVIFPNLKDLGLEYVYWCDAYFNRDNMRYVGAVDLDDPARVQFPKLQKLEYRNIHKGCAFQTELIPSHLDLVELKVAGAALSAFSRLPIDSIGILRVHISKKLNYTPELYSAAHRLFSGIKNSGRTVVNADTITLEQLEGKNWLNVTHLEMDFVNDHVAVCIVHETMPQITNLRLRSFTCNGPWALQRFPPGVSKLEKLSISMAKDDYPDVDVGRFVEMLKPLEYLRELEIDQYIGQQLKEKIQKFAQKGYPWLKDLKITFIAKPQTY